MVAQKQSPVFLPAKRREHFKNATVGWYPPDNDAYAEGYFDAAEAVVAQALDSPYKNRLIFPICYLYRHAIEVVLKELIRKADKLIGLMKYLDGEEDSTSVDDGLEEFLECTHSLKRLYDALLSKLAVTHPGVEIPAATHAAIIELHNRDSNGESFRYSRAKRTGRAVFDKQESFDVQRIAARLGEAFRFLSWGVGGALSADIDSANDYLTEMMRCAYQSM